MKSHPFLRRGGLTLTLAATSLAGGLTACNKDLDRTPFYDLNTESVYRDPANYIKVLAKCYAGFNLSGNPGHPDVFDGQQRTRAKPPTCAPTGTCRS